MTGKQEHPARPAVTVYGDRQTDNPTAILRDRQTDSLPLQAATCGTDWFSIVFLFLAADSFVFFGVLFCLAQHFCAIFIIFVYLRVCFPVLLSLDSRIISVHAFLFPRRVFFCIAAIFHCLKPTTSFVSTLSKTKENQSSAHARSLPAPEIVCVLDCSLLSCSTLLRDIAIISAALLFRAIVFL